VGHRKRPTHAGTFHVTARSSAEERIFRDDRDYVAIIHELAALVRNDLAELHELCVMPTHYHLLGTFREGGLSDAIHRLNRRYASGFNRRHSRRGKVFDSPFGAVEIQDDVHDRWLDIYLAENPPRRPWPWSSADADFGFLVPRPWRRPEPRELGSWGPSSNAGRHG
jgi:REP element-mobilizing transposase RayT